VVVTEPMSSSSSSDDNDIPADGNMHFVDDDGCGGVEANLTHMNWIDAFDRLMELLAKHYAYTEHRGLDWDALTKKYRPLLEEAHNTQDRQKYFLALTDLVFDTHDGHCELELVSDEVKEAKKAARKASGIDGGYGVVFSRLESGEVAVVYVLQGIAPPSIRVGDIVETVNDEPIDEALKHVVLHWASIVPATAKHTDSERLRFLSRAAPGTTMKLGLRGGSTVALNAVAEDIYTMQMQDLIAVEPGYEEDVPNCHEMTTYHVDGEVGVLTLLHFVHNGHLPRMMEEALRAFHEAKVKAVIVDLRGNDGGHDGEPPLLLSYFTEERFLVEQVALPMATAEVLKEEGETLLECPAKPGFMLWDNSATATRLGIDEPHPSYCEPYPDASVRWHGPTAVIVNRCTLSNGDMTSSGLRRCGATVVGFEGTSGSVSLSDAEIELPELKFQFTMGQSVTENLEIPLEAGADGVGGVEPDEAGLIPRTIANLNSWWRWNLRQHTDGALEAHAVDLEMAYAKKILGIAAKPMDERSFIMIKPDGVQRSLIGKILNRFEAKGFKLLALKMASPGREHLQEHYRDLKEKKFFPGLIDYMCSGPVVAMVWQGQDVVATGRKMLGATKPQDSEPGTIRGDLCIDVGRNVCHGSDSVESAEAEIALWFPEGVCGWDMCEASWIYE